MTPSLTKLAELIAKATTGLWSAPFGVYSPDSTLPIYSYGISQVAENLSHADARLIVAMHAALPALLAVAKAAQNLQDYRRSLTGEENDVHVDCRTGALEDAIEEALSQLSPNDQLERNTLPLNTKEQP